MEIDQELDLDVEVEVKHEKPYLKSASIIHISEEV
jgi:hypothetical protein